MTTWESFAAQAPGLASAVRARFEANRHHVLATLRRDGAPRVSGTEVSFHGPDLVIGSMPGAVKARDLQRDGRFALHAHTGDSSMAGGDAKVSGTAVEVTDPDEVERFREPGTPPGPFHLFRLELTDVVLTSVEGDRLVVDVWREGEETRRISR
ncbi:pyridoxamine 5'-phosphate oxidase family protein [Actinorugispora endophytica]|uniref:Pyridoxamine 5'-phosphate oxidase n=1 Tax=Actinorugispora endophytica TaxID=1605990 RepID=A0A4R6V0Y8_9ACTN|nr:pyridoxamine 5'-phosphate oxidase family protein [Actinorugispora endophytica]TDQ52020.1 pyridoxamine 5'-phosphate oxidase [Actinorugispora endophytica]